MVRSSSYKPQHHRGKHSGNGEHEQETSEPFFSRYSSPLHSAKSNSFFQAKLSVGKANDQYEKEADRVADKVVNQKSSGPVIQKKEISSIQRLVTSKEEERIGTNDARMLRDKEIQEKPEIQRLCADCEKEKEGSNVQQKKMAGGKEEEEVVQQKADGTPASGSPPLSSRINNSSGNGRSLPHHTLSEMQSSFNADFSQVRIHTGADAVSMNKELRAQAFTHGRDIYFNNGKYDPETSNGRHLLAHELTHVIQQGAHGEVQEGNDVVQPYRPKTDFNFGRKDSPELAEESFNIKKDQGKKAWIEKIFIHFDQIKQDEAGDWMPAGRLFAMYNANAAAPSFSSGFIKFPLFIFFPISGGKHTELYTHPGEHTVHRIEGVGYSNATEKENEGPNKRYVKDLNSNMSFAIFFHKGEAIHRGGLDIGSHGCVHVDWGGTSDEGDTEQLRRLNYHSVIGLTKVIVTYDPAILPFLCCKRYAHKKKKKGVGGSPCNKVKAETCA